MASILAEQVKLSYEVRIIESWDLDFHIFVLLAIHPQMQPILGVAFEDAARLLGLQGDLQLNQHSEREIAYPPLVLVALHGSLDKEFASFLPQDEPVLVVDLQEHNVGRGRLEVEETLHPEAQVHAPVEGPLVVGQQQAEADFGVSVEVQEGVEVASVRAAYRGVIELAEHGVGNLQHLHAQPARVELVA